VAALGKIAFDIMNCQTEGQGTSCRLSFCLLGSRARGTDRKYSDWDIGVTGGRSPIATSLFLSLKIAVDDVTEDFVRGVDLINLDEAPLWFLKKIDYQPVFLAGSQSAFDFMCGIIDGVKRDG
jgi:predicted nucleotidyltransferase